MALNILPADFLEYKVYAIGLFILAFLGTNFRQDFANVFLYLTIFAVVIFFGEITGFVKRQLNLPFLTSSWDNALILGIVGLALFLGAATTLQAVSTASIFQLQSENTPVLATSKLTGALAQTFLVPIIENLAFFGQGLQIMLLMGQSISSALGLGSTAGILSFSSLFAILMTASAFTLFHLTAKVASGTIGLKTTFIFGVIMASLTIYTKQTAPGIITHQLNNGWVSYLTLKAQGVLV